MLLAGILALVVAGVATAARVEFGNIILNINGTFSPSKLPQKQFAPITLKANGQISTKDGKVPPRLDRIVLEFDKDGKVNTKGLPVCQPGKLTSTDAKAARKACPKAIVGTGFATAQVTFPEQAPIPANAPLTIFNGPKKGGNPTVIVHAYTTVPAPTTFIVTAVLRKGKGAYRYKVDVQVPQIAGGYGAMTSFRFKVFKKFKVGKGKRAKTFSYATARCSHGNLQARGLFKFADGTEFFGKVVRPCKAVKTKSKKRKRKR